MKWGLAYSVVDRSRPTAFHREDLEIDADDYEDAYTQMSMKMALLGQQWVPLRWEYKDEATGLYTHYYPSEPEVLNAAREIAKLRMTK